MTSSSGLLLSFASLTYAVVPDFSAVVAFDYYDGPEKGLAIFQSGMGVRFDAIADSESREQRAFELVPLEKKDWLSAIAFLFRATVDRSSKRVHVPPASLNLTTLRDEVFGFEAHESYLAIGDPNLLRLSVTRSSPAALAEIRRAPRAFDVVAAQFSGRVLE
jgi:hypothetical protein